MFGLTPDFARQQGMDRDRQRAMEFAQMSPQQQSDYGIGIGASGLVRAVAPMMGLVDPQQEQAQRMQQVGQGADLTTPEGWMGVAQKFQALNMPQQAAMAVEKARAMHAETQKQAYEASKARLADVQATEIPKLRHEEAMARLALQAQTATQNAANTALSIKQREESAREANAIRLEIAKMNLKGKQDAAGLKPSEGQKAVDRAFGKEYAEYQAGGGSADIEKQLAQLEQVSNELAQPGNDYTGPVVGLVPDKARSITNPNAVAAQNRVEEVAQRNLRLVLGAQFTQVEGERLIARAYNKQMPPLENKARVDALIRQIRTAAQVKEDAAKYFEENGTLTGWKGRMPTLSDFEKAIDAAKPSVQKETWIRNEKGQLVRK